MEVKLKFNEDAKNYDLWRPTYTQELFADIIDFSAIHKNSHALEIGIGTGQATVPILKTGCDVTAIEIGDRLAKYSKEKFSNYNNFDIKNIAFEDFEEKPSTYDLIYSATAFHWIPQELGYSKAYNLLKSGGTLALFWNHPYAARENNPIHVAIQKIYNRYRPSPNKSIEFNEAQCVKFAKTIENYGFVDVNYKLYHQTRRFDAKSYIALLNTYSDHRAMNERERVLLETEVADVIHHFGGSIDIYDTMDLYLARKM